MTLRRLLLAACLIVLGGLAPLPSTAQPAEPVDAEAVALIRQHALDEGRVMEHLATLTDVHGPRLTGSPGLARASAWVMDELASWGLENVHLEPWGPFGLGWELERFSMHLVEPAVFPVLAYPLAWSPGFDGPVQAEIVRFEAESEDDFARYRGQLRGKIVLLDEPRPVSEPFEPHATRRDEQDLLELANAGLADVAQRTYSPEVLRRYRFGQAKTRFVYGEEPLAILRLTSNRGDYGTFYVAGASAPSPEGASYLDRPRAWDPKGETLIPQIGVATEHYNRLYRLAERGLPLRAEVQMDVRFYDDDPMEYNVIGEIPGTDPRIGDEVVTVGAHLDSWHAGTGATDNGAGSAVMMEVMRVLTETYEALGRGPRRTIRIALWTGEEQGLYGSTAHVQRHYAESSGLSRGPAALKPDHDKFSVYLNMDNGTGKIRGVFLQGNDAVRPIFRSWLEPFREEGTSTLTLSGTGSTDHVPFDRAGLPGFQFIQDRIAYGRTHHSNMDLYDHALEEDLEHNAAVIATFAYHAAERDEKLPRKPLAMAPELEEATGGD